MVKGITRRVVVVHPKGSRLFQEAIFILKDDQPAFSAEEALREACRIAERHGFERAPRRARPWPRFLMPAIFAAGGLGAAVAIYLIIANLIF